MAATNAKADNYYSILDSGVLTIYYGTPTTTQQGLNTYYNLSANMNYQFATADYAQHINKVVIDRSMRNQQPSGINYWFRNLPNLEEVTGLGFLSTKGVTILDGMFEYCIKLRKIEFSTTVSGVKYTFSTATITSMFGMFSNCSSLRTLDLSTFDTQNVTRTATMFQYCSSLQTILVGNDWNMSKVTGNNGRDMFGGCNSLCGKIKYSSSNTNNQTFANTNNYLLSYTSTKTGYATILNGTTLMFCYDNYYNANSEMCFELNSEDQEPGWISQNGSITNVIFNPEFNSIKPTSFYKWFYQCTKLTSVEGVENLIMYNATNLAYMFYECSSLQKLDLSSRNTSTKVSDFSYMFYNCKNLSKLKLMSRTIYSDTRYCNMSYMFAGCSALTSSNFLEGFHIERANSMSHIFSGCSSINGFYETGVAGEHINVSLCENLSYMFSGCSSVQDLSVLKNFNTSSVTNMECMFMGCSNITELRLESFDTKRVTQMKGMFGNCSSLKLILVSPDKWSIENVTSSAACFSKCTSLVGGKGTTFSSASGSYAHIDQGASDPGYFTPYSSTITYILNGGSMGGNPFSYTIEDATFQINNPSRTGYIFDGWSGTGIDGLSKSVKIKQGSTYPREYTAHWTCDLSAVSAKLTPSSTVYTGKTITYTIEVNGETLREGSDYTLSNPHLEIKEPKTYSITINGVGAYTNSKTFTLTISKAPVTVTPDDIIKVYGDADPELTYTIEGLIGSDQLKSLSISRAPGEDANEYDITATAEVSGYYTVECNTAKFTIIQKTIAEPAVMLDSYVELYTGSQIKPTVHIFDGTKEVPSSEYIVTYANNTNLSTSTTKATATVNNAPDGNYIIGSASATFEILNPADTYTVTYKTSLGDEKTTYVKRNSTTTQPSFLTIIGYTLEGVYKDASYSTLWNYETDIVNNNITLYAKFSKNKHSAIFIVDGEQLSRQEIYYNDAITFPTIADKTGHTFSGWLPALTNMPDEDVTFAASHIPNKHKLVFKDGTATVKTISDFPFGDDITTVLPEKEHYAYHYDLPSTGKLMPDNDVTIEGEFVINCHIITFKIDGKMVAEEEYNYGATVLPPATPAAKEGHVFSGWTGLPSTMPDYDVVIEASYIPNKHTVTFIIEGETTKTINTHFGQTITNIAPHKEGYVFVPKDGTPDKVPDYDITVEGKYSLGEFTIYYKVNLTDYQAVTLHYGDKIEPIAAPVKEGYVFSGWKNVPATMPGYDITIYGTFKKDNTTPVSEIAELPTETRVWAYNRTIYIETALDSQYKIIDLQGRVITTSTTKSNHEEINLSHSGIFIIVVNDKSYKVSVR